MNLFLKRLGGFYKYRFLMQQLVTKDIKLKYRRSFLGYLWSILNPLMVMVIMVIVFSNMFRSDIVNFPVYLIIGQTLYNFMSESTTQAIFSIIGNASLLKKTYVPKYVFTVSKITSSFVNMVFALGALVIVFVVCRVVPNVFYLFIPVILLQEYLFCLGLGMLLAQGCVFFRDIQHIYNAVLTAWMYLTPLFYPITLLPGGAAETGYDVKSDVFLYHAVPSDRAGMPDAGSVPDSGWICGSRSGTSGWSVGILKDAG